MIHYKKSFIKEEFFFNGHLNTQYIVAVLRLYVMNKASRRLVMV